jgi:tetratricopeptide (TPR) repeat protein
MALSGSTRELTQQADAAYDRGNFLEASSKYAEVVAQQPNWPKGYHKLGRAYAKRGRHRQAVDTLKKAVELGLETGAIHHEMALSYRQCEEYKLALVHAEKAVQLEPQSARHYDLAGQLRSDTKEYAKALGYFRRAVEKDRKFTEAYVHLAAALETLERPDEALSVLINALRIDPASLDWEMLGRLLHSAERGAAQITTIANELPPEPSVWVRWGRTLLNIDAEDLGRSALVHALELACEVKDSLDANAQLRGSKEAGTKLTRLENDVVWPALDTLNAPALTPFDEKVAALLTRFGRPMPYSRWAGLLWKNQKRDSALALTNSGLTLLRGDGEAHAVLSWIETDLPEQYVAEISETVEVIDDQEADLAWAEVLLNRLKRCPEAEHFLQRVLRRNGKLPHALIQLAVAWANQNKYDEAYGSLKHALQLYARTREDVDPIKLTDMVPVFSHDGAERRQEVSELIGQIDRGTWFAEWARVLSDLDEPSLGLLQLQAAAKRAFEVPEDILTAVLLGKDAASPEPRYDLIDLWATFLQERDDKKGLIQLSRVIKGRDVKRALAYVRQAIEGLATDNPLRLEAGAVFNKLGAPAEAISCYWDYFIEGKASVAISTTKRSPYVEWINALMSANSTDKANGHIAMLKDIVEQWIKGDELSDKVPEVAWDEVKRRRVAYAAGIEKLLDVVQRNVDDASVCIDVADSLCKYHEYRAAIRVLQQAASLNHRVPRIAELMGWSLIKSNRASDARSEFQRSLNQREDGWSYMGMARAALRLNDTTKAIEWYARAAQLLGDPEQRARVYEEWAWALTYMGELDEALEKAARAREAHDNIWANFRLGQVCMEMRRYEEAIEHYENAWLQEKHPYPRHNIAGINQELGRYRTARRLWQDTCKAYNKRLSQALTDRNAEYLFNYGNVQAGTLGNRIVGELLYRIGLELDASHTRMRAKLGSLYMEQKKHAESSEDRNRFQSLARQTWNKA